MLSRKEQILLNKIGEEINLRADFIAQGGARDYPEYRESVGFIKGLEAAIKLLEEAETDIAKGE